MGNPHRRRLFGFVVFVVLLTAFGGLGFAQEEPEAEQPAAEEEAYALPTTVGEITVTARKVEEDIQDVPVSISTLAGEDLQVLTTGGVDVRMLSGRVPSLVMESSFGRAFPRFYIRGLGNSDFDLNASQPVSLLVDEIVLENPVVKGMPLFDLDRVEVLRGPQGTLFGRNTPAGVVKFETVKPGRRRRLARRGLVGADLGPLSVTQRLGGQQVRARTRR
jgi:iron complex outermembrane receptor protein